MRLDITKVKSSQSGLSYDVDDILRYVLIGTKVLEPSEGGIGACYYDFKGNKWGDEQKIYINMIPYEDVIPGDYTFSVELTRDSEVVGTGSFIVKVK
jgi:hypothetical protein